MPACFSFSIAARNCGHVAGSAWVRAWAKSPLLYQKPTPPTLYGTAYCLPLTCQPAAVPPMLLIHGLTYFVRSATLPAFCWSTRPPPPQLWNTSGGLSDCSAIGILVLNCSFCSGTALIVMPGCCFWNSAAMSLYSFTPGPCVTLCHHTSVWLCSFPPAEAVVVVSRAVAAAVTRAARPRHFHSVMRPAPPP